MTIIALRQPSQCDGGSSGCRFRSLVTLGSWLDEFRRLGGIGPGLLKVIQQDGDDGADTGLVACQLESPGTWAYIQPERPGSAQWMVTLEPREDSVTMSAGDILDLASRLALLSELCAFLQAKSEAFVGQDAM